MKILYFGTACEPDAYEKLIKKCRSKPSIATVVFETALLEGFRQNGAELDVYSFPMIPTFPNSPLLGWGRRKEHLDCGYDCTWLRTWNVPFLKQLTRRLDGRRIIKKWIKEHKGEDCAVLSYSVPPFLARDMVSICRKNGVKVCAIVPDLPANMYMNHKANALKEKLRQHYLDSALKVQADFDGYVYLTEPMHEAVGGDKPYVIVEGIAHPHEVTEPPEKKRAVMYAGGLHEKYGVLNLIDAFEQANLNDTELWLFGAGNAENIIKKRAADNLRIKFFGRRSRDEVLACEAAASILVNPRGCEDEFTRYSFPSKTIEYMCSGTPVLTTKLPGIPKEYFEYVFTTDDNSTEMLREALITVLSLTDEELAKKGETAKEFVLNQKNAGTQSKRVLSLLEMIGGNESDFKTKQ